LASPRVCRRISSLSRGLRDRKRSRMTGTVLDRNAFRQWRASEDEVTARPGLPLTERNLGLLCAKGLRFFPGVATPVSGSLTPSLMEYGCSDWAPSIEVSVGRRVTTSGVDTQPTSIAITTQTSILIAGSLRLYSIPNSTPFPHRHRCQDEYRAVQMASQGSGSTGLRLPFPLRQQVPPVQRRRLLQLGCEGAGARRRRSRAAMWGSTEGWHMNESIDATSYHSRLS
jgi:hypothetical protein